MPIERAHIPNPIPSEMELMDLHIGCVKNRDDAKAVAITLQPPDALLTEKKVGTLVTDWPSVWEVISGLVDQATIAFGTSPLKREAQMLYLGLIAGSLSKDEDRQQFVEVLAHDQRVADYVAELHGRLAQALTEAGKDDALPLPDACAECGKTSTRDSMWALYCMDCIEQKIAPGQEPGT